MQLSSKLWKMCGLHILTVIMLCFNIVSVVTQDSAATDIDQDTRVFMKFGPISLTSYEDVGSQEVIYVQVPSAYLSNFVFEWFLAIATDDGTSAQDCPKSDATVLVRRYGIPIPNPQNATYPDQTWIASDDTARGKFPISSILPDQDRFVMLFNDSSTTTGEYYISIFLAEKENVDVEIPGKCKYFVQLCAATYSEVQYGTAAIESITKLQSLDNTSLITDYVLERSRENMLSTDFVTNKEGYNIITNFSANYSWMVEPYSDVGGTLQIKLGFDKSQTLNGSMILKACAAWNPKSINTWKDCRSGYKFSVDSSISKSDVWYWPFPRSGLWILDVGVECTSGPCDSQVKVELNVNIIQCIESCHSDKSQGQCKLYRTDVIFFSACDCKGGWRGIACTDGRKAVPRSRQLLMTLLLTLSNLIFLPCGVLAIVKKYYSESVVYFFVMFFSTFYHACDNDFAISYCLIPYNTLQFSDFYGSITAMWVTLIAVAKLPFRLESLFHILGIMAIGIAVTYNRFSALTTLIPVLVALFILAVKWGKECRALHHCYPSTYEWMTSIVPGSVCAIIGFVLFVFVEKTSNYFYVHSLWHILMGSAVLFLIPRQNKYSWTGSNQVFAPSEIESITGIHYNNCSISENGVTAFHMEMSDSSSDAS